MYKSNEPWIKLIEADIIENEPSDPSQADAKLCKPKGKPISQHLILISFFN